jgi:hypothetical protein
MKVPLVREKELSSLWKALPLSRGALSDLECSVVVLYAW